MLTQRKLDPIPAGDNPFLHDAFSVGLSLENIGLPGVYVMSGGKWAHGLYIVNTATGLRTRIDGIEA